MAIRIGIPTASWDYCDNFLAIEEDGRFDVIKLTVDDLATIDVLIIEGIQGSPYHKHFIDVYSKQAKTVVWQTSIWPRVVNDSLIEYIQACDWFMGYDEYVERLAQMLGKQIWTHYPLFHDKFNIMQPFDINRQSLDCVYSANMFHTAKLGYSMLKDIDNYIIYYGKGHDDKQVIKTKLPGVEYREEISREDFINIMNKECKLLFQIAEGVAWGKNILDAVRLGIPSISNTFWQRIFYPDLYCQSLSEASKCLSWDYSEFEPYVSKAQNVLNSLLYSNAKKGFCDYLWRVIS